jgi:cytochrome c oxidase cbb3-type subunit 2/cytochrome c oxidase cbb3-type subunit I/II
MPSYRWYFEEKGGVVQPKQEAKDLVAYLQSLGIHHQEEIQALVYPKLFKVVGSPNPTTATMERGTQLFAENCSGCHGNQGDGLGKARDFLAPASPSLSRRYVSASEAYSILNRGVFGSAMPSFREMPSQDLWSLAEYVSSLGVKTKEEMKSYLKGIDSSLIALGKKTYQTYCISCHGEKGAGDGAAAAALNPRPKDFTRRVFEKSYFVETMKTGIPGSAMVAFTMLTDEEVKALHAYLGTLFNEEL